MRKKFTAADAVIVGIALGLVVLIIWSPVWCRGNAKLVDKSICLVGEEPHYISLWRLPNDTLVSVDNVDLYADAKLINDSCSEDYGGISKGKVKIGDGWYEYRKEN